MGCEEDFLRTEFDEEHDGTVAVAARGYWEGIWLRLKKDKLAIAGGIFIVCLFFVAFVGAPLAAHFLGHGPNDINPIPGPGGGLDDDLLPVKPWTYVNHFQDDGTIESQLYILGADGTTGRDEFLRTALRRPGLARGRRGRDVDRDVPRRCSSARSLASSAAGSTP